MITINLLPEELRKQKKSFEFDFKLAVMPEKIAPGPKEQYALIGLAFALIASVICTAVLIPSVGSKKKKIAAYELQWSQLKDDYHHVLKLEKRKTGMTKRRDFVQELMSSRLLWSKKMSDLSDSIPANVWLNHMGKVRKTENVEVEEVDPQGQVVKTIKSQEYHVLNVKGAVTNFGSSEMIDLIAELMSTMKNNEQFSGDFNDIDLIASWRDNIEGVDIMRFSLDCRFNDGVL